MKVTDLVAGQLSRRTVHSIWEGMSQTDFINALDKFISRHLGDSDHSSLIERMLDFADFNTDGKVRQIPECYIF